MAVFVALVKEQAGNNFPELSGSSGAVAGSGDHCDEHPPDERSGPASRRNGMNSVLQPDRAGCRAVERNSFRFPETTTPRAEETE